MLTLVAQNGYFRRVAIIQVSGVFCYHLFRLSDKMRNWRKKARPKPGKGMWREFGSLILTSNVMFAHHLSVNLAPAGGRQPLVWTSSHAVAASLNPSWHLCWRTASDGRSLVSDSRRWLCGAANSPTHVLSAVTRTQSWSDLERRVTSSGWPQSLKEGMKTTRQELVLEFKNNNPSKEQKKGKACLLLWVFLSSRPPFCGLCSCGWWCRRPCCVPIISNHPATTAGFRLAWEGFAGFVLP